MDVLIFRVRALRATRPEFCLPGDSGRINDLSQIKISGGKKQVAENIICRNQTYQGPSADYFCHPRTLFSRAACKVLIRVWHHMAWGFLPWTSPAPFIIYYIYYFCYVIHYHFLIRSQSHLLNLALPIYFFYYIYHFTGFIIFIICIIASANDEMIGNSREGTCPTGDPYRKSLYKDPLYRESLYMESWSGGSLYSNILYERSFLSC